MADYGVTLMTFTGDPAALAGIAAGTFTAPADGAHLHVRLDALVAPPAGLAGVELDNWTARNWGVAYSRAFPAKLYESAPGRLQFSTTCRYGLTTQWAIVVADETGVDLEVLWNYEDGTAGWATWTAEDGLGYGEIPSAALAGRGWADAPFVGEPEPTEVQVARQMLEVFSPKGAARVLLPAAGDDPEEMVGHTANMLTLLERFHPQAFPALLAEMRAAAPGFVAAVEELRAPLRALL